MNCMYVCMYVCMYYNMHMYMHACVCMCMQHVCVYVHACIHTQKKIIASNETNLPAQTISAVQLSLSNPSHCSFPIGSSTPRTHFLHLSAISNRRCRHASDRQRIQTSSNGPFTSHGGFTSHPPASPHPGSSRHFQLGFPAGSVIDNAREFV